MTINLVDFLIPVVVFRFLLDIPSLTSEGARNG